MDPQLRTLLDRNHGVLCRRDAAEVVPSWAIDVARREGRVRRILPGVYADTTLLGTNNATGTVDATGTGDHGRFPAAGLGGLDPARARRAALGYADGRGALSHLTALHLWGLWQPAAGEPVHLTVPATVRLSNHPGLVVHHVRGFSLDAPDTLTRHGVPVTRLDRALVDSWPLLPAGERRGPVIQAVAGRHSTPARIGAALAGAPKLPGRAQLRDLLGKLAAGCHSPLEIWGHDHVFTGAGMPPLRRQVRVSDGRRTCYLDVYAEAQRVAFELDGASGHGAPGQREVDLRRDAWLATLGIQVVRFSHRRLVHDTAEVRREILAVLAARR
ncbi:DUF559 domain-containing protein [Solwaraspora sp. WMMA2080]|uniref:DUF559 domain-containing protein n=1 Tax=unclassified Solwaraspora TaxID=2627926 RepID=UPI00248C745C|nr:MULTISPECIES: DUF559 domain-containing protein [unclassified Solwaraspora]WBB99757.1 DUF559 domain-containing protein [Solwaraspora sp. WMMA2059]WBC21693.1 DUF559 domain-containing protein [Solwaraspora sp. WMMA2080]